MHSQVKPEYPLWSVNNLLDLSRLVVLHEYCFHISLHHVRLKGMKLPVCFYVQQTCAAVYSYELDQ